MCGGGGGGGGGGSASGGGSDSGPGSAGSGPGGGPSGIGMGGAFGDFSGDFSGDNAGSTRGEDRQSQRSFIDNFLSFTPVAIANAILYGATGETFGSIAQGDPSGGSPIGGPGFDNTAPVSQTSRAITQAIAPPAAPPPAPPMSDDRKRNRVGRQETILTSRSSLSDAPTFRPTLLGQ